jgi:leader peptidase (prepilin peptidase)/N-methyltransferase
MTIFFFILGLAVGSFLNSVIYRLDTGESIIKIRSHCPYCKKTLSWFELIPLVSFILQKGRCRHCKKPISLQYPLVEFSTGILFALCAWYFFPNILLSAFYFLFSTFLIIIFVYDLKHYIIPNEVIYPAIIVAFLYRLFGICLPVEALSGIEAAQVGDLVLGILPTLFFVAIVLVSRGRWMGAGDIKLALFMGLVLGWPKILVALCLAFLIGAFVSIILIIKKKKTLKSQIPFGPFLAGATVLTLFIGDALISWYLGLII